jgi:hypothetical protein
MYGLELNLWAGIKCTGWNKIYRLELNVRVGIKFMGWN